MSQRKEKYLRRTLAQYEGIVKDVDTLKNKTEILEREMEETRLEREQLADEVAGQREREAHNRKQRRLEERERRQESTRRKITALCVGVLLLAIAAAIAAGDQPPEKVKKYPASTKADQTVAETMKKNEWMWTVYNQEIPLTQQEQEWLRAAADEFGVWYPLAVAMVDVETAFQNVAGDNGKSIGYLQVNQTYHKGLMEEIGATDLWDAKDNFRTGLAYLASRMENTDTLHKALMEYNMGPTGAARAWETGVYESEYSRKVVARAEYWAGVLGYTG